MLKVISNYVQKIQKFIIFLIRFSGLSLPKPL